MSDRLLRTTLTVNAILTAITGALAAGLSALAAGPLGIPSTLLQVVGLALLPYAVMLWVFSTREPLRPWEARLATAGDLAFVAGSFVAIAVVHGMTTWGRLVVAAVALVVADLAVLQWVGIRRLSGAAPAVGVTSEVTPAGSPTGRRPAVR
jgi:hypothetical protein